jgi:hypothetical protein
VRCMLFMLLWPDEPSVLHYVGTLALLCCDQLPSQRVWYAPLYVSAKCASDAA